MSDLFTDVEKFKNREIKAKSIFTISEVSKSTAYEFVRKYHYLGDAKFFCVQAFGLFYGEELVGVATYSNPQGIVALKSWFSMDNDVKDIYELSRLCMLPLLNGTNATSFLLGGSIKELKRQGFCRAVITLACSERHVGSIYQVCNFKYYGMTDKKTDFFSEDGKVNPRGSTKDIRGVWLPRTRKHRYAYILDKSLKCNYTEEFRPNIQATEELECCGGTHIVYDKRFNTYYTCPRCTGKLERVDAGEDVHKKVDSVNPPAKEEVKSFLVCNEARRGSLELNLSRESVSMEDISSRLAHKKISNISVKRNQNALTKALEVITELVNSGRLKAEGEYEIIRTPERLKEFMETYVNGLGEYVLDVETTGLDVYNDILVGICLYNPDLPSAYVPFNHTDLQNRRVEGQMTEEQVKEIMLPYLANKSLKCINHNIKFDDKTITFQWGQRIANVWWDTFVAANILNENEVHGLKPLYNKYILHGEGSDEDFGDLFEGIPCNYIPIDIFAIYGANDGLKTWALYQFQKQFLSEDHPRADFRKLHYVFREIEMPLIDVCMDMELRGVAIREEYARELSEEFKKEEAEMEAKCDAYVAQFEKYIKDNALLMRLTNGTGKINYNSPQQVACLFYDIFKLKSVSRKEPRGTGDKIIQQHRNKAKQAGTKKGEAFIEFLDNYQRYKECGKLLGTYIDKIPAVKCEKTNAVHTTFNQYGAKTGRFSSSDKVTKVNLQNIPSHEKRIRKIFKARDGYKLVGGDFSQIEPRVLAYISGDAAMQEAYREGRDLYATIASTVYQMPYEECKEFRPDGSVNPEGKERRTSVKSLLLGVMYERGASAIAEQFNKPTEWAEGIIEDFYRGFPKIQQLRLKVEKMAEEYGYVTTICGRKRRLPDMQISDHDDFRYQEAHRQSLNAVIQGSSADIMKLSMIAIYNDPRYKELDCHMLITVHDELILEVPNKYIKEGAELLTGTMKRVGHSLIELPMSVDAEVNEYWYGENLANEYLEEE